MSCRHVTTTPLGAALVTGLAVALVAALLPQAPAGAHPLPHGDEPRLVNLQPAPGSVVEAGTVRLSARAAADRPVTDWEVRVNGQAVDAQRRGSDSHPDIVADVAMQPGRHDVAFEATTEHGTTTREMRVHVTGLATDRLAGTDRVATAAAISADLYDGGTAPAAVLARADDFPDALAGAPVARAVDGPLLLTPSDGLAGATRSELQRVLADDATVYLLGGEGALGADVASAVRALGADVERLDGRDRFATSVRAAEMVDETSTAFVASGDDFPDALAAAAIAGDRGWPILLTSGNGLPADVAAYVDDAAFDTVYVVGGTGVLDDRVLDDVGQRVTTASRVAGSNRFETAEALAEAFAGDADTVGVASATAFPDALAGGVHAAAHGAPLALVAGNRLVDPPKRQVRALEPDRAVIYGGDAAVSDGAAEALRGASIEGGELRVTDASIRDGARVDELDTIAFAFNRGVNLAASHVSVTIDGDEVGGRVSHPDGTDSMRFAVDDLPDGVEHGQTYHVQVRLLASSGSDVVTDRYEVEFRRPPQNLSRGASGEAVADLQRQLRNRRFWLPAITGEFDRHTHHAVVAFQKAHGLERDGVVGAATRRALADNTSPPSPRHGSSRAYEVDLARGIVLFVDNGQTRWVFDASAGHGQVYTFQGSTFRANTTTGNHRMVRQVDGIREAARGELYRPKYYDSSRGIAIHGYPSVPPYHASSGCVRVTNAAMDKIWQMDPGLGTPVHVYPSDYYG